MSRTRAGAAPGLRPFLPADAPRLAALFRASIATLAAEDYDEDQLAAWAGAADDEGAFAARLSAGLTIIALVDGALVGFASLRDKTDFDMLYVDPNWARKGVASALADAIEKLSEARGAQTLSVDASDTARDFFVKRGYVATSRNMKIIAGEWLGNTTMTKTLAAGAARKDH